MVISQTPLRISFFGGGTDLNDYYEEFGGSVISCTIDKYVFVIVKSRYDDMIVLNYSEREKVASVGEIRHGLIREAMRVTGVEKGVEITSIADIPSEGSGLGSSSSFAVGILNALYAYKGEFKNPAELAEMACNLEIERLGAPIGKQDQYAAAFGGLKNYVFHQDGSVAVEGVPISREQLLRLSHHSNLYFTGLHRRASTVLADQKQKTAVNGRYLHRIKEIVSDARDLFRGGDFERIGALLDEQWNLKRELSEKVENDTIREMYDLGCRSGVYGGKLLGAGGGGYFLFLTPLESKERLRNNMGAYRELPINYDPMGSRIILNIQDNAFSAGR